MVLSIIVPIYNVANYLPECIDSILAYINLDIEIILINDGSTDNSSAICDAYSLKDSRVKVTHQDNKGVSAARNTGLRDAIGNYLLFVDGDDWIDPQKLFELVGNIINLPETPDVIFTEMVKVFDNKLSPLTDGYNEVFINNRSKQTVMNHIARLSKFPGSACSKLFRRDLIQRNQIYFNESLCHAEDIDWVASVYKLANSFHYFPIQLYYYRQNRLGSASQRIDTVSYNCFLKVVQGHADKNSNAYEYQEQINAWMAFEYVVLLYRYSLFPKKTKKELYRDVKDLRWILWYGQSRKTKVVNLSCSIFGVRMTAYLLKIYKALNFSP